jgi:hypothetical protein
MEDRELIGRVKEAVRKYAGIAKSLSGDFSADPEVSGREFESSKKIAGIPGDAGYAVEFPFCGIPTAFRAVLDRGRGPSAAILVEYDALGARVVELKKNVNRRLASFSRISPLHLTFRFYPEKTNRFYTERNPFHKKTNLFYPEGNPFCK